MRLRVVIVRFAGFRTRGVLLLLLPRGGSSVVSFNEDDCILFLVFRKFKIISSSKIVSFAY